MYIELWKTVFAFSTLIHMLVAIAEFHCMNYFFTVKDMKNVKAIEYYVNGRSLRVHVETRNCSLGHITRPERKPCRNGFPAVVLL